MNINCPKVFTTLPLITNITSDTVLHCITYFGLHLTMYYSLARCKKKVLLRTYQLVIGHTRTFLIIDEPIGCSSNSSSTHIA